MATEHTSNSNLTREERRIELEQISRGKNGMLELHRLRHIPCGNHTNSMPVGWATPNAKALDRQVKNFDDAIWKANARRLVTEDNFSKFTQSKDLGEFLLATGDAVLVEAALWFRDAQPVARAIPRS